MLILFAFDATNLVLFFSDPFLHWSIAGELAIGRIFCVDPLDLVDVFFCIDLLDRPSA